MTALCGGGSSGVNIGGNAVVYLSQGLIGKAFAKYGLGWLAPALPLLGIDVLDVSSLCATDPPAMPTFTAAETNALLKLDFGADFDSAIGKIRDAAKHTLWYELCRCTSGTLTPFTPAAPPAGTPIYTTPPVSLNGPCDSTPLPLDGTTRWTVTSLIGPSQGLGPTTQPIKYVRLRWTNTINSGGGYAVKCQLINFYNPGGGPQNNFGFVNFTLNPGESRDEFMTCPVGTNMVRPDVTYVSGTGSSTITYRIDAYCSLDLPGAPQQPCCPPDIATQSTLDLIVKMVTLIQRQAVPFAYVAGASHSGLSGNGTIGISGLIGVKVTLTTDPATLSESGFAPVELFDRGYITWGTPDGYPQSVRVEHNPQVSLPARAGAFTELAYDFHPGVVATITELLREP